MRDTGARAVLLLLAALLHFTAVKSPSSPTTHRLQLLAQATNTYSVNPANSQTAR